MKTRAEIEEISSVQFSSAVEQEIRVSISADDSDSRVMNAVLKVSEDFDIEPEDAKKYLSPTLVNMLREERIRVLKAMGQCTEAYGNVDADENIEDLI